MNDSSRAWLPAGASLKEPNASRPTAKKSLNRVAMDSDVFTAACERTAYVMDNHDRVCVAFSGGKDSTAVLNVALEVAHSDPRFARHLPLRVVFYDEEAIPFETEEYVRRVAQRPDVELEWYCLPVQHRNACSRHHPYWWPWAPEDEAKWCRPLPPEAITTHPHFPSDRASRPTIPDFNGSLCPPPHNTALLMGIRAQESLMRLSAVTKKKVDNYIIPYKGASARGNLWKAYPVYDWRTEDVWTAPAQRGWDYNRAYDLMEMAGITPAAQRCSPAFGEEPIQKIYMFAQCFPDVWERMAERLPGVGAAYRYALTELYCFRGKPEKPASMPWPDWCKHFLNKFEVNARTTIAKRIRSSIKRHYRCTSHPILASVPHPDSGLHWEFLLHLAMRGDFKNRRQEAEFVKNKNMKDLWHAYAQSLEQHLKDGTYSELAHPRPFPSDAHALIPDRYLTHQENQ